jgi:hypothetical protein
MRMAMTLLLGSVLSTPALAAGDPEFGSHWHDGRAELDGYRWTGTRYGEERSGNAVMVYVTEPFSASKNVKVEDASRNPADTFDVLKLNLIRDFQTGIYDYNTMVSVFVRSADFSPVKTSFTSAEWCGHVYAEQEFGPNEIREKYFSYFEDESSATTLNRKEGGIVEDNLFILLRGLRGDFLGPGETRSAPFLAGAFYRRLAHRETAWGTVNVERLRDVQTVDVPAGRFAAIRYVLRTGDGRRGQFDVESAYPHRIVRWSWSPDENGSSIPRWPSETGELTGTARLKYWELNGNGNESYLKELGLPVAKR